jgi:hypothetical protein
MKRLAPFLLLLCGNTHAEMFSCIDAAGMKVLRNIACEKKETSKLFTRKVEQLYSEIDSSVQTAYYRIGSKTVYLDNTKQNYFSYTEPAFSFIPTSLTSTTIKKRSDSEIVSPTKSDTANVSVKTLLKNLHPTISDQAPSAPLSTDQELQIDAEPLQEPIKQISANVSDLANLKHLQSAITAQPPAEILPTDQEIQIEAEPLQEQIGENVPK